MNDIFIYFVLTRLQSKNRTDIWRHNNFKDVIIKNFHVRKDSEKKINLWLVSVLSSAKH